MNSTTALDPTTITDRKVRLATEADLSYVVHLQKIHRSALGFLKQKALLEYIRINQTIIVEENGDPAGYLNWNLTKKGLLKINQVAVDEELLRSRLGRTIYRFIEVAARKAECSVIRALPRGELFVNRWFADLGFNPTAVLKHCNREHIPHIEWSRLLVCSPDLAMQQARSLARLRRSGVRHICKIHPDFIHGLSERRHEYVIPRPVDFVPHIDQSPLLFATGAPTRNGNGSTSNGSTQVDHPSFTVGAELASD